MSNGEQIENPRFYRKDEADLKRVQKRKDAAKHAANWPENATQKRVLGKIHERISNRRSDFAHKRSRELVNQYQVIVFEDLAPLEMGRSRGMRKSIMDVAWTQFISMTIGKAAEERPTVLHGAIRPRNLKLSGRGRPLLLDYALLPAQTLAADMRRSDAYLAPEVITGGRVDARSDLYALAATLYHLLVGIPPVDATTRRALVRQGAPDPLQPLHQVSAAVPAPIGVVLQAALALDPHVRPQTAAHFQALLRDAQAGHAPSLPIEAHPRWPWQRWRSGSL